MHNYSLKHILSLLLLICASTSVYATHNRAGEITYVQISDYTYEITLTTYTDARSLAADRPDVYINWGDGDSTYVHRKSQTSLPPASLGILKNIYIARHQYAGPGKFMIHFWDPNRIDNILNIDNSVSVPFYIESLLIIDPKQGNNSSPILLQPPIDFGCVGRIFVHNPNAYDPDGDSLYFSLVAPRRWVNADVPGYFRPPAKNFFELDSRTGQLTWDYPQQQGIYNIAIRVDEYRRDPKTKKYYLIGFVIRDMQIIVNNCNNHPPVIEALKDTCVEAGKNINLSIIITASDPDVIPSPEEVTLTATGGPFLQKVSKAVMKPDPAVGTGKVSAKFEWNIACEHIRKHPYRVVFRAVDNNKITPLSDLKYMDIRVVGPAPQNLQISALSSTVTVKWDKPVCDNVKAYLIYRKADSSNWKHDYCETGVPSYTGYQLIDTVVNPNILTYIDNNRGIGLSAGIIYCYRVTALYLSEQQQEYAEGYSSDEVCVILKKDIPVITNASVESTSNVNGKVYVAWSKPTDIDTLQNPGPYEYILYRTAGYGNGNPTVVTTFESNTFSGLNDTTYIDTLINTVSTPYAYRIDLYNTINGEKTFVGKTVVASTIYLTIRKAHQKLDLRWNLSVPWRNLYYVIERKNEGSGIYDSIGYAVEKYFEDTGLVNGKNYCYRIRSVGSYFSDNFVNPIINLSQEVCSSPRDTIKPCAPVITAEANCDDRSSNIQWTITDEPCSGDVVSFNVYYSPKLTNQFNLVGNVSGKNANKYTDKRNELRSSLAGCYVVTAVDSFGNESIYSNEICVDNCPIYELPNVFTPNGDNINDKMRPMNGYRFVSSIDLHIFNRWGQEVFNTTNPEIEWDGKDMESGKDLKEGVYFYICTVNEIFLDGTHTRTLQGTVHIIR